MIMSAGILGGQKISRTFCLSVVAQREREKKTCPPSVNINSVGTGHLGASVKVRAEISLKIAFKS